MGRPNFIKVVDESVYFKGPNKKFIFFVPEKYFERNCAIEDGEYIELIGILNYTIVDRDSTNYAKKIGTFNYPSMFVTKPGYVERARKFQLTKDTDPQDYRLLIYEDNDIDQIISSTEVPQDIANVEQFIRLFVLTGNIPKTIPYDKLHEYFLDSIKYNGGNYKVTAQLFGILLSETCRSKDDPAIPFRLSKEKIKDHNMHAYETMRISQIPKFNGPFNSLTSENWDESLIGAMMNPNSKGSPPEPIMMGGWDRINRPADKDDQIS